jgi:hypothetical protein
MFIYNIYIRMTQTHFINSSGFKPKFHTTRVGCETTQPSPAVPVGTRSDLAYIFIATCASEVKRQADLVIQEFIRHRLDRVKKLIDRREC